MASERGRSVNTLAAYRRDLDGYSTWMQAHNTTAKEVQRGQLDQFVQARRASGAASASVARQLAAVRMLHRFMVEEGVRPDDPSADVEGVRVPAGIPHPLTEAEVAQLLAVVVGTDPVSLRDRALLELLYATGARIGEVCGLALADFDRENRMVRVFGKGAKERIVPFGRAAESAMDLWFTSGRVHMIPARWARRGDEEAVFLNTRGARLSRQSAWAVVKKYGTRVRRIFSITVPTFGSCRNSWATPRSRLRRCTPRSAKNDCGRCIGKRIRAPSHDDIDHTAQASGAPVRRFAVASPTNRQRRCVVARATAAG